MVARLSLRPGGRERVGPSAPAPPIGPCCGAARPRARPSLLDHHFARGPEPRAPARTPGGTQGRKRRREPELAVTLRVAEAGRRRSTGDRKSIRTIALGGRYVETLHGRRGR